MGILTNKCPIHAGPLHDEFKTTRSRLPTCVVVWLTLLAVPHFRSAALLADEDQSPPTAKILADMNGNSLPLGAVQRLGTMRLRQGRAEMCFSPDGGTTSRERLLVFSMSGISDRQDSGAAGLVHAEKTKYETKSAAEVAVTPGLAAVIEAWPSLPEAVRAGIVAMVKAARNAT